MAKKTLQQKKEEELNILENPATNHEEGFQVEITEKDIQNFPELEEQGVQPGDTIVIPNEETFIPEEQTEFDPYTTLIYYSEELVNSLGGIFIGGAAAQKRDQLIEFLSKIKK